MKWKRLKSSWDEILTNETVLKELKNKNMHY